MPLLVYSLSGVVLQFSGHEINIALQHECLNTLLAVVVIVPRSNKKANVVHNKQAVCINAERIDLK